MCSADYSRVPSKCKAYNGESDHGAHGGYDGHAIDGVGRVHGGGLQQVDRPGLLGGS